MRKLIWIFFATLIIGAAITFSILTPTLTTLLGNFGLVILTFLLLIWQQKTTTDLTITQLTQAQIENALQLQEQRNQFETLFNHSNIGIAMSNLDGRFIRANHAFASLLGYTQDELLAMNLYGLIHPSNLPALQLNIQELIDKKTLHYSTEEQCFRKNGESLWLLSTLSLVRDSNEQPIYFMFQVQNITLQKAAEARLRHMAYHDPLTGLANRNKLEQFITHILASAKRHKVGFALIFLDLDRFKNINDTIGHDAGDLLLQIVAERLRSAVRNTDMVARLGGDEFVLLITDVIKTEAVAIIAQKILENVLRPIAIQGQEIYITTSVGISIYPHDGQNLQTLMKNADLALYRAKEHGRNNYQFYTTEMTSKAQVKLALQNALGHALVRNEFYLHYQPTMDIKTRRIMSMEAFLRWKNNDYALIKPAEIIALAEETGLIVPVSTWILRTACQQLKAWHELGFTSLTIGINCSAKQFKQATFEDEVLAIIKETGLAPNDLELEVTEATIMQDPDNILRALYSLKDKGVIITIDDFGTGYWSLSNLRRLSVDRIKVDKSFIRQLGSDESSGTIISAILAMVNKLGIISIAEGVETREQYEFLKHEGCTEIQGYYLTQSLDKEAMTKFLRHPVPDAETIHQADTTP